MILNLYRRLKEVADKEFPDITEESEIILSPAARVRKLRISLIDGSFIDVWYSLGGEYSYHWEQRGVRDYLYRHDNAPHEKWSYLSTFPQHCHEGSQGNVVESHLPKRPEDALRKFLVIVREKLSQFHMSSDPHLKNSKNANQA